jgi:hypothetical protein
MRPPVLLLLCGLAGCQTTPRVAQEPPPTPVIRLCQHDVPAEESAITQELTQYVAPGMPLESARARLEPLGFRVFGTIPKAYRSTPVNVRELLSGFDNKAEKNVNKVELRTSCDEIGAWGQRCIPLRVVLYFDKDMKVGEMKVDRVGFRGQKLRFAWYFSRRPNLREPLGMSVDEARKMMEAEGFRCKLVTSDRHEKSGRPYLYCRAVAETPLGGSIIRVRLFHDEAGKVTDTRVLKEEEPFDELLCTLPDSGDTLVHAALKTVVFPVRLYAAFVVAGLQANMAMAGH